MSPPPFNLANVLRALLFSSTEPLSIKDLQGVFARFHDETLAPPPIDNAPTPDTANPLPAPEPPVESPDTEATLYTNVPSLITATQIREAMDQIASELREQNTGFLLIEHNTGYRLMTHPRFARWIRVLRREPPPAKLSQSSAETLAIIAYRQPVTRTEIETIRGVSAEAGIAKLLEREIIYVVGRADLPGRPIQYGTTDAFLTFVGLKSLNELPASDVLSSRQIDEWLRTAMNAAPLGDAQMGLPNEELPLERMREDAAVNSPPSDVPATA